VSPARAAALMGVLAALSAPREAPTQSPPISIEQWADSARREIDSATTAADVARLAEARALVDRLLERSPTHPLLLHYAGYALYHLAILHPQTTVAERREAADLIRAADAALDRASRFGGPPETKALRGIVIGQQIGRNPLKGFILGPRSKRLLDDAIAQSPQNPRVWLLRGAYALHSPEMFGGGAGRAEEYLLHAIELFENDQPALGAPAWGRAEVYAWLGLTYTRKNQFNLANEAYRKALEIEPGYAWVGKKLLPALQSAHGATGSGSPTR